MTARNRKPKPIRTRIERLPLKDLKLLDLNARFMHHSTYRALVDNLRRDGALTSVPFACKDTGGKYLVLSGNHRVQAAIDAGIAEADVMVTDDKLPKAQRVAIQLSHNALAGEDDPATLKTLYDQLEDVDWRRYSGLDDKALELLDEIGTGALAEASLAYETVTLLFLPTEKERAEAAWEAARAEALACDELWLARLDDHSRALDAMDVASTAHGVKNVATSLLLILDIFDRHATDLQAAYLDQDGEAPQPKRWVPLETLFGTHGIPAGAASTVARALARMRDQEEITDRNPWQALEYWAADYLAGT